MAKLLHNRVAVRLTEHSEKTAGGLIIPKTAQSDPPCKGTIVYLGTSADDSLNISDTIYFHKYAGNPITLDGDGELLIIKDSDILAVL